MRIEVKSFNNWLMVIEIDSLLNYRVDFQCSGYENISSILLNEQEFKSLIRFFVNTNIRSGQIYNTPESFFYGDALCEIACTYQAKNDVLFFTIYKFLEVEQEDTLKKLASFQFRYDDFKLLERILK